MKEVQEKMPCAPVRWIDFQKIFAPVSSLCGKESFQRALGRFLSIYKSNGRSSTEKPQKHKKENKNHIPLHRDFLSAMRDERELPQLGSYLIYGCIFVPCSFHLTLYHSFHIHQMLMDHCQSGQHMSLHTMSIF